MGPLTSVDTKNGCTETARFHSIPRQAFPTQELNTSESLCLPSKNSAGDLAHLTKYTQAWCFAPDNRYPQAYLPSIHLLGNQGWKHLESQNSQIAVCPLVHTCALESGSRAVDTWPGLTV
ncbi:hypothetical protein BJX66DRAFT_315873 [Aspergillus keveii]|uniref:Uncharacterized protein n=1 Tax=Aspergillus keveii TaxID=714993 RepID=A0ABR4FNV8_9EURO